MKALESRSLWLVYMVMILAGLGLDYHSSGDAWATWHQSLVPSAFSLIAAPLVALVMIVVYRLFSDFFGWSYRIKDPLRQVLTPLSYLHASLLAVGTSLIEEWFFRGLLLPRLGLVMTSALFALAHLFPHKVVASWTLWHFVFGLVLGFITRESQSLVPAMIVHSLFNIVFLIRINKEAYRSTLS